MSGNEASVDVDRLLGATGGGRVLCIGDDVAPIVAAFRSRAVDAHELHTEAGAAFALPNDVAPVDIVYVRHALDRLDPLIRAQAIRELLGIATRAVLVRSAFGTRDDVEREWLAAACRKHPLHQQLVNYNGLDWERDGTTLLVEPLPANVTIGRSLDELAAERDLHMDMLREPGRRADAHVARYTFARQFIRPGDRVLDAACGLGYGTAILNDGTLADSVVGIDTSGRAIEYATAHYGPGRPRVSFAVRDVRSVVDLPPASLDVIVSFETLEHIEDPDAFLAACRRALTPAGRIVCSVPNDWTNAEGVDPNPHHLHVFDRARLEEVCRRHFLIEGVHGQTAGGGMKLSDAGRRMWKAGRDEQVAEWWLLVGMTEPAGNVRPVRHRLAGPTDDATNILAFDRDYDNPWLVRAMVVIGLRAKSEMLLGELAAKTFDTTGPATPDAGAALCVQAYRHVGAGQRLPDNLRQNIHDYVSLKSNVPHTFRWQVSLSYVVALSHLQQGEIADAARAFEACASSDALRFAPHLATKTVGAAFLRGWIALQSGCTSVARHWWTIGIDHAERALRRPWSELMLNRDTPAIFGLREATVIVDLASQCATGLALSSHAADRPGLVASQLFESLRHQLERASNVSPVREPVLKSAGPHEIERVEEATSRQSTPEEMTAWRLIDELDRATLVSGETRQLKVWQVTDADGLARCVYLHPPAALKAVVPTGAAGKLTMAVGLHPDVWTNPEASGCIFSINADDIVVSAVALDPLTRPGDRRWVSMSVDVPASTTGQHIVTLDTQKLGTGYFAWGLFKDVTFRERNNGEDGVRSGIAP